MALSELSNILSSKNYTVFISSNDKVSGTNNNGTYQINWDDILPRNYLAFKCGFMFQSGGGKYTDGAYPTFTATTAGAILTVTSMAAASQPIILNQVVTGGTLTAQTYISGFGTGTGGIGTYTISINNTNAGATVYSTSYVFNGGKIVMNSLGRSFSFDTSTKSESYTLGFIQRDVQSTTSSSNSFSAFYLQAPPKTMSRPNQNMLTISIYNNTNGLLLTDTSQYTPTVVLTDMTPWNMILEFTPIDDSIITTQYY